MIWIMNRERTSGKNNSFNLMNRDTRIAIRGQDFTVNVEFANSACNQLCVLRTEIEDEDFFHVAKLAMMFGSHNERS